MLAVTPPPQARGGRSLLQSSQGRSKGLGVLAADGHRQALAHTSSGSPCRSVDPHQAPDRQLMVTAGLQS
jgi:hypothetical protein